MQNPKDDVLYAPVEWVDHSEVIPIFVSTNRQTVLQKSPLTVLKCAMHFVRKQLKK